MNTNSFGLGPLASFHHHHSTWFAAYTPLHLSRVGIGEAKKEAVSQMCSNSGSSQPASELQIWSLGYPRLQLHTWKTKIWLFTAGLGEGLAQLQPQPQSQPQPQQLLCFAAPCIE